MTSRLTGFDTLSTFKNSAARFWSVLDPQGTRARTCIERSVRYRERLVSEVRKRPKLASGIDVIGGSWATLVDSFCATIDPYLSRYFPDIRLVAVVTASGEIELHKIVRGSVTSLGPVAALGPAEKAAITQAKWTAIELRLSSDRLLQRTLSLPAASRDFLGPIIEHRLERLTPWRSDRVLYGYRMLPETESGGGVGVVLTATSKDFVTGPLALLKDAGLVPTAIGGQEESLSEPLRVDLFRGPEKAARMDSRCVVSRVALATFGTLGIIYLGSSIWVSSERGQQQDANAKLMKARHLLKASSMDAVGDRERALLEAKRPDKAVVVLVDKLATAIAEDTFLKELAVTPDKVRLAGISANAPALIRDLERTGLVNVRFTSAVTREKDQKDNFEIAADRPASGDGKANLP